MALDDLGEGIRGDTEVGCYSVEGKRAVLSALDDCIDLLALVDRDHASSVSDEVERLDAYMGRSVGELARFAPG